MKPVISSCALGLVVAFLAVVNSAGAAPSISNSSFEVDTIAAFPTYRSVTNWGSDPNIGVNDVGGPFWDNGKITSGTKCAFIQQAHSLTQSVPGFEAGKDYDFKIRVNSRASTPLKPQIKVTVGSTVVIAATEVTQLGAVGTAGTGSDFTQLTGVFTSPGAGAFTVKIENTISSGDNTLLVDEVEIVDHIAGAKDWNSFR